MKTQELVAAKVLPERPSDISKTNFITVFPIKKATTNIRYVLGRKQTNRLYWCDHSGENVSAGLATSWKPHTYWPVGLGV